MVALLVMLAAGSLMMNLHERHLRRQRGRLLQDIGLLQAALLPDVPAQVGALHASIAYRPAAGPAAGGDFYDVFELEDGRVGVVIGDVVGHGRDALAHTALLRYTLRAYLETGLEPRQVLRIAGQGLDRDIVAGFATTVVATCDPQAGTLTYASAGHPAPILVGPSAHQPVTACSSPPIGMGFETGLRQTTVSFTADSLACFFTDGLVEARLNGGLLGRERVAQIFGELGPEPSATELLDRISRSAHSTPDDMAACIIRPRANTPAGAPLRIEELELHEGGPRAERFLTACGVSPTAARRAAANAHTMLADHGDALLSVEIAGRAPVVRISPATVATLDGSPLAREREALHV